MNAILAGLGKALAIWPNTDYEQFIPQVRPTTEAWLRTEARICENLMKIETSHPELQKVKVNLYKRSSAAVLAELEDEIEYAARPQR